MIDATGGTERVALEIARIQAQRGADVTIASIAPTAWRGAWEGVNLRHLRPYSWAKISYGGKVKDLREHLSLTKFVRLGRFDLVHLHEYRRTRFLGKQPKVMHFHNNPLDGLADATLAAAAPGYWRDLGSAGAQIAVSSFVAGRLRLSHERAGEMAPASNIVVNQSGVDADALSCDERREARKRVRHELGLTDSDVLLMFAGAVRPEKGVIQLAQAFSKLSEEHDNAFLAIAGGSKLWIDGDGPQETTEQQVRAILTNAVARRRASMLGVISPTALPSYYAAADVFVLPSMFQETFGLVILEAFAAGIPVIGARSGGVPELVENERNGLLVDQGDVDGLCRAMRRLLLDRTLRERLGAEARQTAVKMSWDNTVDRLERIYEEVLSSN
ncbi:glycosyltransferase family 4 protein [Bradyrhizobium sp. SZCCHNS1054]|uniref:glycosyltransferase family 4 protein n=1 Tax=Bradyrhizobium sp. SZCCHNS1054 TaxID=3057301 RepID=UPI0029160DDB|nr:glycosyltransferase family 4 protein [Bradyrhizobium sp. SZCCHNS1054]